MMVRWRPHPGPRPAGDPRAGSGCSRCPGSRGGRPSGHSDAGSCGGYPGSGSNSCSGGGGGGSGGCGGCGGNSCPGARSGARATDGGGARHGHQIFCMGLLPLTSMLRDGAGTAVPLAAIVPSGPRNEEPMHVVLFAVVRGMPNPELLAGVARQNTDRFVPKWAAAVKPGEAGLQRCSSVALFILPHAPEHPTTRRWVGWCGGGGFSSFPTLKRMPGRVGSPERVCPDVSRVCVSQYLQSPVVGGPWCISRLLVYKPAPAGPWCRPSRPKNPIPTPHRSAAVASPHCPSNATPASHLASAGSSSAATPSRAAAAVHAPASAAATCAAASGVVRGPYRGSRQVREGVMAGQDGGERGRRGEDVWEVCREDWLWPFFR
eukprot:350065-Chlamydomonas_euryale.AAC.11